MIRKSLLLLLVLLVVLAAVILIRTWSFAPRNITVQANQLPRYDSLPLQHLMQSISYKTVSYGDSARFDSSAFIGLREFLQVTYPLVHAHMHREIIAGYSLLFRWEGKDPALNPIVLMAHQDVVPVEEGTENIWTIDPFKAVVKDGYVWGRGTADDKINLIMMMESAERLLREGFQPDRTIYFAFGHDEEVGGTGAQAIAALLVSRNVRADLVLDEGGIITREKIPGMENRSVALMGTSEKGALSVELSVEQQGGHSAMPADETSIDILTRGIVRLREKKFEARFSPSSEHFAEYLGPEMPFTQRMAFANLWLFRPMINSLYEKSREGNAMIRTTVAPTIIRAGIKDNVVPTLASATINLRLLPGDSSSAVVERIKTLVDDERISVKVLGVREATAVTDPNSFAFTKVDSLIRKTHQDILPAPFLMIAATDSRYFGKVSDGIVKFSPMVDPIGFHGIDERVSLESVELCLWFYEQLMRNTR